MTANSAPIRPTLQFLACSSYPCHHGGTCIDLSEGSYQCECETNWTGAQCQQAAVPKGAFHSFRIIIYIKRLALMP
jgi:hypothetical protein